MQSAQASALAADLELIGIHEPVDLKGRDPFQLYHDLCTVTAARHDPCVIDAFISAVRFMDGKGARVWWDYTAERKRVLAAAHPDLC